MTSSSVPLHPDDLDTVLRHMLEVEEHARGSRAPAFGLDDLPAEEEASWRRWAEAACAGAGPRACNVSLAAYIAARGMARVLAEQRKAAEREEEIRLGFTPGDANGARLCDGAGPGVADLLNIYGVSLDHVIRGEGGV